MSDCFYLKYEGDDVAPLLLEFPGEIWKNPDEAGRLLAQAGHVVGSCGIWCSSRHVHDKAELRRRLDHVVDQTCGPEFKPDVEEHARRFREAYERVARDHDSLLRGLVDDPPMMVLRTKLGRRGLLPRRVGEYTGIDVAGFFDGRVRIDAEDALRLAAATGTNAGSWLWAQASTDIDVAEARGIDLPPPMTEPA